MRIALNMRLRPELMSAVRDVVERWNVTQSQAADRLGVTQPRLNDLLRGRIARFGLDGLVALTEPAGLAIQISIAQAAA